MSEPHKIIDNPKSACKEAQLIIELLQTSDYGPESEEILRLDRLRRIFAKFISSRELCLSSSSLTDERVGKIAQDNLFQWNNFLLKGYNEFLDQLYTQIRLGRKWALRTTMGVIASSPFISSFTTNKILTVNERLIYRLLQAAINRSSNIDSMNVNATNALEPISEDMITLLEQDFFIYRDVQYFALLGIRKLADEIYYAERSRKKIKNDREMEKYIKGKQRQINIEQVVDNLVRILLCIKIASNQDALEPTDDKLGVCSNYLFLPPMIDNYGSDTDSNTDSNFSDNDCPSLSDSTSISSIETKGKKKSLKKKITRVCWQNLAKHRRALQSSFLAVTKIPHISQTCLKRIIRYLPLFVLPSVPNPLRFAELFTCSYANGGIIGLLSLHGLFELMMNHGYEYPNFYSSLYQLIDIQIFYAKYRTMFFTLLSSCLQRNTMLPAYLVAAFCKKLCRCALSAPPTGVLFVLALISNLLRKHGECQCLLHRKSTLSDDPYAIDEKHPMKSQAIDSSLWELNALEKHYHPAVSILAESVGLEDESMPMYDLNIFLLHTYNSLFESERKRGLKKRKVQKETNEEIMSVTFQKPKGLFIKGDIFNGAFDVPYKTS